MKLIEELLFIILILIPINEGLTQDIIFEWKHEIPSTGRANGNGITTDSDNNSYVVGHFSNSIELDNESIVSSGSNDGILIKVDEKGNFVWNKKFKCPKKASITSIALDQNEDIIIVGAYQKYIVFDTTLYSIHPDTSNGSTMFIAKFTKYGELLWAVNTGGYDYSFNKLVVSTQGDIFISAKAITINQFGNASLNVMQDSIWVTWDPGQPYWLYYYNQYSVIAKYSSDGSLIWCKQSGGNPRDIILDNSNNIILAGQILGKSKHIYGDNNYFYGDSIIKPIGTITTFLSKHDSNGELIWLKLAGGTSNNNYANDIEVDNDDNIYFTGQIGGTKVIFDGVEINPECSSHAFIAKYSANGNMIWVKDIGSPDINTAESIYNGGDVLKINAKNELIFCGFFKDKLTIAGETIISSGGPDLMVLKMNLEGEYFGVGQFVRYGWTQANGISFGTNNEIFLVGYLDEWNSSLPSQIFIGKIGSDLPTPVLDVVCENEFNVFPNPTVVDQKISIKFSNKKQSGRNIIITDVNGNWVLNSIILDEEFSFIPNRSGKYIISSFNDREIYSKSIIVAD